MAGKHSLEETVRGGLAAMGKDQRRRMIAAIQDVIDAQLALDAGDEPEVACCPRCGSVSINRDGHDASGGQRWRCRDCGRRFGRMRRSVLGASKLDAAVWKKYAECLVDVLTLREAASKCGVSLKTAWFMRIRLLQCLYELLPSFRVGAGNGCQLDECYFTESFSGNHTRNPGFQMPRPAKRRGVKGMAGKPKRSQARRGISKDKICVLTGVSDTGDFFFDVACRGPLTRAVAESRLEGRVVEGAIVCTDKHKAYPGALRELGVAVHDSFDARAHKVNRINAVHSSLSCFMDNFRGVATRRLGLYMAWFKWRWSFSTQNRADMIELVLRQAIEGSYADTRRELAESPYLFMDYYGWPSAT